MRNAYAIGSIETCRTKNRKYHKKEELTACNRLANQLSIYDKFRQFYLEP